MVPGLPGEMQFLQELPPGDRVPFPEPVDPLLESISKVITGTVKRKDSDGEKALKSRIADLQESMMKLAEENRTLRNENVFLKETKELKAKEVEEVKENVDLGSRDSEKRIAEAKKRILERKRRSLIAPKSGQDAAEVVRQKVAKAAPGALTEIAGSSDVFDRGFVTYSNAAKQQVLGVPAEILRAQAAADGILKLRVHDHQFEKARPTLVPAEAVGTPLGLPYPGTGKAPACGPERGNVTGRCRIQSFA